MDKANLAKALEKALNTSAGTGGDFLPTPLADEFIDLIRDENFCRQMFRKYNMISKTRDVPKILTGPGVYYESTEATEATETTMTTGTVRLTARKLMSQIILAEEIIEDSAQDFEGIVTDHFTSAMAEAEEQAMLVGDPSHTAAAGTVAAATDNNWFSKDARTAWYGLVTLGGDIIGTLGAGNRAANRVYASGNDMSTAIVRNGLYNLGKYGRKFSKIVCFVNPWSSSQLLDDSKLVTLEKYGPKATVFTGEIGALYGKIKCINSSFIPDGYAVMTHIDNPFIGDRRQIKLKEEEVIKNDTRRIVISERMDFKVSYQDAICQIKGLDSPTDWS